MIVEGLILQLISLGKGEVTALFGTRLEETTGICKIVDDTIIYIRDDDSYDEKELSFKIIDNNTLYIEYDYETEDGPYVAKITLNRGTISKTATSETTENDNQSYWMFLDFSPNWVPYKAEKDGKEVSLSTVWGSSIKNGGYLTFTEVINNQDGGGLDGGHYTEYIGIYENADNVSGDFYVSGNGRIQFQPNNGDFSYGEISVNQDKGIIKKDYDGTTVYFRNYLELDGVEYQELTKELEDNEIFYVTKVKDNNNGTYTLYGAIYKRYTAGRAGAELSLGEYKKVTVSSSMSMDKYQEAGKETVKELFSNFSEQSIIYTSVGHNAEGPFLSFTFKNGKCTAIEHTGYGI